MTFLEDGAERLINPFNTKILLIRFLPVDWGHKYPNIYKIRI